MKRQCVLDVNYLCRRAWYAMSELQYGDVFTGVIFGVLRDLISFQDRFQPQCMIFCFDFGRSIRYDMLPEYKSTRKKARKKWTEEDVVMEQHFEAQVKALRKEHLRSLGYQNIFYQKGFEADDVIAGVIQKSGNSCHSIIISGDNDFYQLLGERVSVYHPRPQQLITLGSFRDTWGVEPTQWIDIKALAGCKTDDIPGIKGIGEKTAAQYIAGNLNPKSKAYQKIVHGNQIWKDNIRLVQLPLPGLREFQVHTNEKISAQSWEDLAERLGFKTLRNNVPGSKRKGFGIK